MWNDAYKNDIKNKTGQTNSNLYIKNTFNEIFQNITSVLILFVKYSPVCVCVWLILILLKMDYSKKVSYAC